MNRLTELTAERRIRYTRTMARYVVKQAGDLGFALVDRQQRIGRGWYPCWMDAWDAKLKKAEEAAGSPNDK